LAKRPSVSAIMPAFNAAGFIHRAIDSVLDQGDHLLELIIVDDCSRDQTRQLVRRDYGTDERVKLLWTDRNSGPGAARNLGISAAAGDWIAPIDADDRWTAERLDRRAPLLGDNVDIVFDNVLGCDHADAPTSEPIFTDLPAEMTIAAMAHERAPGTTYNFGYLKPLVRKSFLDSSGVRYPDIRISEDLLFYLELLIHHPRITTTGEAGYIYTIPVSASRRRSKLSVSVPDDLRVAALLDDLVGRNADLLAPSESDAIRQRAMALRRSEPLSRLYDSWTRRDYRSLARNLLSDSKARRALLKKLAARFGQATRPSSS
jgi:succinoglycan biosynthesis protein ExoO